MTGQPDLFGGRCEGRSGAVCMSMEDGMVCRCSLVGWHRGPCKCSNCGLLFEPVGEAHARRTDPSTSQAAAARVEGEHANRLESLCVRALRTHGRMTIAETAEAVGMDKWSISPRFAPLKRKGLIRDTGEKRDRAILFEAL